MAEITGGGQERDRNRNGQHDGKKDVLVVDYVDSAVPVLARMAAKRRSGYRALGYVME